MIATSKFSNTFRYSANWTSLSYLNVNNQISSTNLFSQEPVNRCKQVVVNGETPGRRLGAVFVGAKKRRTTK